MLHFNSTPFRPFFYVNGKYMYVKCLSTDFDTVDTGEEAFLPWEEEGDEEESTGESREIYHEYIRNLYFNLYIHELIIATIIYSCTTHKYVEKLQ